MCMYMCGVCCEGVCVGGVFVIVCRCVLVCGCVQMCVCLCGAGPDLPVSPLSRIGDPFTHRCQEARLPRWADGPW